MVPAGSPNVSTVYTKFFLTSPDMLTSSPDIWLNSRVALRRTFFFARHVQRTSCRLCPDSYYLDLGECQWLCDLGRYIKPNRFASLTEVEKQLWVLKKLWQLSSLTVREVTLTTGGGTKKLGEIYPRNFVIPPYRADPEFSCLTSGNFLPPFLWPYVRTYFSSTPALSVKTYLQIVPRKTQSEAACFVPSCGTLLLLDCLLKISRFFL